VESRWSVLFFSLILFFLASCEEDVSVPKTVYALDDYASLVRDDCRLNSRKIREEIRKILSSDTPEVPADRVVRDYYLGQGSFLWIDRLGADGRADTLLACLDSVAVQGLDESAFCIAQITKDLQRVRTLSFDSASHAVNKVMARLEYNLTKSYLRYAVGERYGFVDPARVFNHLDVKDSDSVHVEYHKLFDIPMRHASQEAYAEALRKISRDSVGEYVRESLPRHPLYVRLQRRLRDTPVGTNEWARIVCNMERLRWRVDDTPDKHRKYVLVNVPSFRLLAVDGDSRSDMRVGCGTLLTKTPLLTSRIHRMDINPQWIIPKSIVEKSIARHAGDSGYFARHHYFIRERRSGKRKRVRAVSASMLKSKDYMVIQEGGQGNSLGRIIFRFDNAFSVYLHDTSTPGFFSREDRGVSHGCVRVEQPLALATFLLDGKDEKIIDKIKYSMSADVSSLGENAKGRPADEQTDTLDKSRLVSSLSVTPEVPVFITYFTLYPDADGTLLSYPDAYGYDKVLFQCLRPLLARRHQAAS